MRDNSKIDEKIRIKYSDKLIDNFHKEGILNATIIGTIEKGPMGKINVVP